MAGALSTTQTLTGTLSVAQTLSGVLSEVQGISGALTVPPEREVEAYTGAYTVTPSGSAQTLPTSGLKALSDITVNPIPSNYGLITWNGSTLTVS